MSAPPIGDLCVLREGQGELWSVALCQGGGRRERLGQFPSHERAVEFAIAERDRRRARGVELGLHFPDDCPCYVNPTPPPRAAS